MNSSPPPCSFLCLLGVVRDSLVISWVEVRKLDKEERLEGGHFAWKKFGAM